MEDNGGSCVPDLCEDCVTDGGLMVNDIIINRDQALMFQMRRNLKRDQETGIWFCEIYGFFYTRKRKTPNISYSCNNFLKGFVYMPTI